MLADSSVIYAQLYNANGLPTIVAHWGSVSCWYANLEMERDIDVLWMGQLDTARRRNILANLRSRLAKRGVNLYVVDNKERPFVFGDERTLLLNRAKITLNITRTWYDDNFSRLALAAPNRSLVVSEPLLPHCPLFKPGVHYVSAAIDDLAETIVYYLQNDAERQRIVNGAYRLAMTDLRFGNSVKAIFTAVDAMQPAFKVDDSPRMVWNPEGSLLSANGKVHRGVKRQTEVG
jgi:hypothetical protein